MSDYNAGERRIVNQDKPTSTMPVFGLPWADGIVPVGFGLVALLGGSLLGLSGLSAMGATVLGVLAGGILVYLSPSAVTTSTWVQDMVGYVLQPTRIYSASETSSPEARNEGGLLNLTPFQPDVRTEEMTGVRRAWPGGGVVLRSDGRMEAAIEIKPPNMDFAVTEDWKALQRRGKQAANDLFVKYPETKLHISTEPFDVQTMIDRLEDRLTDDDLQNRDVLFELVQEYKEHRPRDLQNRGTQKIRMFLIVTVDPSEATTEYLGEPTPKEKMAQIPLLGLFMPASWSGGVNRTQQEMYAEMAETAGERLDELRDEFYKEMEGHDVRRLSTIELFGLGARFWNGNDDAYQEIERVVRDQPVMRAGSDTGEQSRDDGGSSLESLFDDGGDHR